MERLQITLLILLSSSWFLTCENEEMKKENIAASHVERVFSDSSNIVKNVQEKDFTSAWLSLPFSGSGSNWFATINVPELSNEVITNNKVSIYMRKSDSITKLNYQNTDNKIEQGFEPGAIIINSNFYPESIEFMYIISRDGTFVKQNIAEINYTAKRK